MKLVHAITSLGSGGAQSMLLKLMERGGQAPRIDQSILSLMATGGGGARPLPPSLPIDTLGMRSGLPTPRAMLRLLKLARRAPADLVVGWMHHGALAAWHLAGFQNRRPAIIWNVRHSLSDIALEKPMSRMVLRRTARLSAGIDAIIFNSEVARRQYAAFGYHDAAASVIPNGFDCSRFTPSPHARARLTELFGIDRDRPVIGMLARWHPMKDPALLIEAVRRLRADRDVHLLIVGAGMDRLADHLPPAALAGFPADRLTLADQRHDVHEWLPGLDLLVLPSAWGEAFPNVLGEAMACGVPCIATDIGDSGWVIGDTGCIVPPRDAAAMHAAIDALLALPRDARRALGSRARARIEALFSIDAVAARYVALYESVSAARR